MKRNLNIFIIKSLAFPWHSDEHSTYHNGEEYANDGHTRNGGPVGYANHRREGHAGSVHGDAKVADLSHDICRRCQASHRAALEPRKRKEKQRIRIRMRNKNKDENRSR